MLPCVRDMADPTRLPENWSMHLHPDSGRHFYVSSETQESTWEHPLLRFYLGHVFMERGGSLELEHNAETNPPTDDEVAAMAEYLVRTWRPFSSTYIYVSYICMYALSCVHPSCCVHTPFLSPFQISNLNRLRCLSCPPTVIQEVKPTEDPRVVEVARLACCAPYPAGWVEERDAQGEVVFRNTETGEVSAQHPLDDYFLELARRRRNEVKGIRPVFGPAPNAAPPKSNPPSAAQVQVQEDVQPQPQQQSRAQSQTFVPLPSQASIAAVTQSPAPSQSAVQYETTSYDAAPVQQQEYVSAVQRAPQQQAAVVAPTARVGSQEERIKVIIRAR